MKVCFGEDALYQVFIHVLYELLTKRKEISSDTTTRMTENLCCLSNPPERFTNETKSLDWIITDEHEVLLFFWICNAAAVFNQFIQILVVAPHFEIGKYENVQHELSLLAFQ